MWSKERTHRCENSDGALGFECHGDSNTTVLAARNGDPTHRHPGNLVELCQYCFQKKYIGECDD